MNVYESTFLIIGKGITYSHCRDFFEKNHISYSALTTRDIIDVKKNVIICSKENINTEDVDYLIISPGINPNNLMLQKIMNLQCKVVTDIEILQSLSKSKFICVSGTNGKTSTVNLISDILIDNDIKSIACGNNGGSVFEALKDSYDYVILELSSYQLEYIKKLKSYISIILNLSSDHLERHKTMDIYFHTKLKIFTNAEHSIVNKDLNGLKQYSTFEVKNKKFYLDNIPIDGLSCENNQIIFESKSYILHGQHESLNLCACISVIRHIGLSISEIISSFSRRTPLQHRVEEFLSYKGIKFINDSKSTNADATCNALESIKDNVILIMGGDYKNISYKRLIKPINEKVKLLITIGVNKEHLYSELDVETKMIHFDDLDEATSYIFSIMVSGDTVLMSPGTSSFYYYKNFEDRGNHFKRLVRNHAD